MKLRSHIHTYFCVVIVIIIVGVTFAVSPPVAMAGIDPSEPHNLFPRGYWGPLVSCVGSPESTPEGSIKRTCTSVCDLLHTFQHFVYFGMTLVIYVFTPIMIIWGGVLILTAGAASENLSKGRSVLKGTVVGVILALGAFVIINTFLWALGIVTGQGSPTGEGKLSWPNITCVPPTRSSGATRSY